MKKSLVYALLIVFALGMTTMACKKAEEATPAEPAATEAAPAETTDTMAAEESASDAPEMMEEGDAMEGEDAPATDTDAPPTEGAEK